MEPQVTRVVVLLVLVGLVVSGMESRVGDPDPDSVDSKGAPPRSARPSGPKVGRCSYTFIVPQQKLQGALCVSHAETGRANGSETAALRAQLSRQQEQLEVLRAQLGQEGALASEVHALRRENEAVNSRVSQLYAQLLQEVTSKQEQVQEQRQLEGLLLNATTQMLQISSSCGELEKKYESLATLVNSQSQMMARLEKQCQCRNATDVWQEAASSVSNKPARLENAITNVQRDQSAPQRQEKAQQMQGFTLRDLPTDAPFVSYPVTKTPGPWRDCQHVLDSGESTSGIYLLRPRNSNRLLQAWCEHGRAEGGWTVIQRRQDGSVNFFRTWDQYKQGFGNLDGEYWLTSQATYKLQVVLEDWQGRQVFAEYDSFRLEPESDWYRLRLGGYHGNAGDSLSWHSDKAFTTLDRDKDAYSGNCAH
ncbi:angiopoietin-related protein 6 isoform X2 [Brachyhypopomus gauderio]|uniref:angiopoietin-related protein 6 isoform X2 n=1 Tax=Brachyhypopomus gauderio TaxID=698409 RepID=UPI00404236E0